MAKGKCELTVNGEVIRANIGETLIDAGLGGRVVIPHDCCSGQCETCRVRVLGGAIDDAGTREKNTVLACVATLDGDAEITFDPVPLVRNTRGTVERIDPIADGMLEVRIRTRNAIPWLPGQYLRTRFAGLPPRDYSPTFPFALDVEENLIVFHIKVYPDSQVSAKLGGTIGPGHGVTLRGPFGNGFLRNQTEPLVLASTGTGFAPIWAIAVAAAKGQPNRPMRIIAGARETAGLYMLPAVDWLRAQDIQVVLTAGDGDGSFVRRERPSECLGALSADDVVYSAGAPSQVDAMRAVALAADATFYADPFYIADRKRGFREWAADVLVNKSRQPVAAA